MELAVANAPRLEGRSADDPSGVVLIGLAAVLAGFNLRLAIESVPPLLDGLRRTPGLSATAAPVLTAVPFACFGVVALVAPRLVRRFGAERTLAVVLVTIGTGTLVRAAGPTATLLAGTAMAAAAVAVANVVLPVLIRARCPAHTGLMIGLYIAALGTGAALAGAITVPLAHWLGWQGALAVWAIPTLLPLIPLLRARRPGGTDLVRAPRRGMRSLLRDRLAWQVTLFFGLQAAVVFSGFSRLPSVLRSDGYSASAAGLPLAGLVAVPGAAPGWVALFALGQGASFSLAVSLIALRSPNASRSADLSGMAQAIGYTIAAAGPLAVGMLHGAVGGWTLPLVFILVLCLPMALTGLGAGRALRVSVDDVDTQRCNGVTSALPDSRDTGSRSLPPSSQRPRLVT
jgi:MFS transporter, CP family, cyanate transporter